LFLARSRPEGGAAVGAATMTDAAYRPTSPPRAGAWVAAWLAMPGEVVQRLADGGAALELGCGSGLSCLALAEAFPAAHITGRDRDDAAVTRARALARTAALDDRLQFQLEAEHEGDRLPRATYDLIVLAGGLDPDPRRRLNQVRNALRPEGTCLLVERRRPSYGGRADTLEDLRSIAEAAGFSRFRPVAGEGPLLLLELRR
jgi:SAM-dependent methyltransferase